MIFAMMSMVAFNLVDTFYVGKLGTDELAALSFTFPVILVVVSIALGLGMGTSAVISRAIGEGDHYKVQRLTTDGLLLALNYDNGTETEGWNPLRATADITTHQLIRENNPNKGPRLRGC